METESFKLTEIHCFCLPSAGVKVVDHHAWLALWPSKVLGIRHTSGADIYGDITHIHNKSIVIIKKIGSTLILILHTLGKYIKDFSRNSGAYETTKKECLK